MRLRVSGTTLLAVFVILLFGSFSALAPEPDFGGSVINYFQTIGKPRRKNCISTWTSPTTEREKRYGSGDTC